MPTSATNLQRLVDELPDGLYFVDRDRTITYWNKAAELITGYPAEEVVGRGCRENILVHVDEDGKSLCRGMCPLTYTMDDCEPREATVYLHHKQGHRVPVFVRATPHYDEDGQVIGGIELFSDASSAAAQREKIANLEKMALLDELTQLPNRRQLEAECKGGLSMFERTHVPVGLLFMDIDHFKHFNDDFGHDIGDVALRTVSDTLRGSVRPFDAIGRWGGEEFVAVLPNTNNVLLERIGQRLCHLVRSTHVEVGVDVIAGAPERAHLASESALQVTISIGATQALPGDDIESLVQRADELLYQSKHNGRDRVTVG